MELLACPSCDSFIRADWSDCRNCGADLSAPSSELVEGATELAEPLASVAELAEPVQISFFGEVLGEESLLADAAEQVESLLPAEAIEQAEAFLPAEAMEEAEPEGTEFAEDFETVATAAGVPIAVLQAASAETTAGGLSLPSWALQETVSSPLGTARASQDSVDSTYMGAGTSALSWQDEQVDLSRINVPFAPNASDLYSSELLYDDGDRSPIEVIREWLSDTHHRIAVGAVTVALLLTGTTAAAASQIGKPDVETTAVTAAPPVTTPAVTPAWTDPQNRFRLHFPSPPTVTDSGGVLVGEVTTPNATRLRVTARTSSPGGSIDKALEAQLQSDAVTTGTSVESKLFLTPSGRRELHAHLANANKTVVMDSRYFFSGNTLVALSVTTGSEDGDPQAFGEFVDSFTSL